MEDKEKDLKLKAEDDSLVVSRKDFENLLQRVTKAEEALYGDKTVSAHEKDRKYTATMRLFDDKYVVGLKKNKYGEVEMKPARNEKGEEDFIITLELLDDKGKKSEHKCFYLLDFMREARRVKVEIIETKSEKVVKNHGVTERQYVADGAWDYTKTGNRVALEEVSYNMISKVRTEDGREIEVNNEFLNM